MKLHEYNVYWKERGRNKQIFTQYMRAKSVFEIKLKLDNKNRVLVKVHKIR